MSDDIEWLKDENQRLKEIIVRQRQSDNDYFVFFPYDLKKDIAKGWIDFDNLTQEKWNEIRSYFYKNYYGTTPPWEDEKD